MKILITGTDGFVGSALKEYFHEKGHNVFGTVFRRDAKENEVRFDIKKAEEFSRLPTEEFDAIIHTAGIVDQTFPAKLILQVNAEGTRRMLAWAKENRCRHFIQVSSVSVYGHKTCGQNRLENKLKRYDGRFVIPYMRSKAKAEKYVAESGMPYTSLRLPPIIGQNDTCVTQAIAPRLLNNKFYFCGSGNKRFSVIHVKNFPPIVEKIIEAGPLNDAFNCSDHEMSWREFVNEYAKHLDVDPGNKKAPLLSLLPLFNDKDWAFIISYSKFGGQYPSDKLKSRLEEYPVPYSWEDGIRDAVDGFLEKQE